ncbi:caspase 4 [Penaeus vannamei]|uniref:Caspase 4 n=1 Tax=Penaeus vannamei TaxID=6689 RepID=A0A423SBU4_PENVA|nr:caspase 4 [Penaeus vannamei]
MLFLSINPNKIEEQDTPSGASGYTDSISIYKNVVVPKFRPNETSDSVTKLLEKFKSSLSEKSIAPVRRELEHRILKLKSVQLNTNTLSTLESNLLKKYDQLSNEEEDILEFTEIFEMFNLSLPESIRVNFGNIISSKKIPLKRGDIGNHSKTFFVYAENKIMMKICDSLSPQDVYRLYEIIRELEDIEKDDKVKDLLSQQIDQGALEEVPGLKDVAFYYLTLTMMRKQLLNRLYTHRLAFLFDQLKEMKSGKDPNIDRILDTLNRYPVVSRPPGLCIVFNITENREGSTKDVVKVKELFEKEYKFDVLVKEDPTANEITDIVSELKAARYKFYDSLVVWFMSHGDETFLQVKNEKLIHRRVELIQPFTEIEWFNKKPKLFFIQACAGKENRKRSWSQSQSEDCAKSGWIAPAGSEWLSKYGCNIDVSRVNSFADTLISYATMWYQPASRGKEGSLYVDTLVDQLREHGWKENIENVLRRVHYNVNTVTLNSEQRIKWKQAPYFESSLQKAFIFPKP